MLSRCSCWCPRSARRTANCARNGKLLARRWRSIGNCRIRIHVSIPQTRVSFDPLPSLGNVPAGDRSGLGGIRRRGQRTLPAGEPVNTNNNLTRPVVYTLNRGLLILCSSMRIYFVLNHFGQTRDILSQCNCCSQKAQRANLLPLKQQHHQHKAAL